MEVERDSVKLSLSNDLTKTAYHQSMKAHNHNKLYYYNPKKHGTASSSSSSSPEVSIFAFPGSWEVNDWYPDDLFGETEVDCKLFPSLRRIGENRLAKVNAAFLRRFQELLNNSTFKTEVDKAVKDNKKTVEQNKEELKSVEDRVQQWKNEDKKGNEDVYWGESLMSMLRVKLQ